MSRHIVLTGASKGLGRAMVDGFIEAGHRISGCGRSKDAIAKLKSCYPDHHWQVVNVAEDPEVADGAASIPAPDLLVNNAALMNAPAPLWEVPAVEFNALTAVNINGIANTIRHFTPRMLAQGSGVIVNFSSGWGRGASANVAPYCASKWAVEGLSAAMAQEVPPGLAVVAINPGVINTDMLQKCWSEGADGFPDATTWARNAVPYLLSLGPQHNGQALTCP
jgi:NAD(P)-dependent dehydrogenase (short-subunit alcohol dehydrogenase family)